MQFVNYIFMIFIMYTIYNTKTKKRLSNWIISHFIPAATYSPTKRICSTISARGLNFCVRNGNRCDPSAITTRKYNTVREIENPGNDLLSHKKNMQYHRRWRT